MCARAHWLPALIDFVNANLILKNYIHHGGLAGKLVIERLSKEKTGEGMRYLNLLSTMDIPQLFRKVLTRKWPDGALLRKALHFFASRLKFQI